MQITVVFSRNLRKLQTNTEKRLWFRLKNRKLHGVKFRRQQRIGRYIVDFINFENKLIVELDGYAHRGEEAKLKDQKRTEWLEKEGYRIIRFWNSEVDENMDEALAQILTLLPSSQHPSPLNGEGGIRKH